MYDIRKNFFNNSKRLLLMVKYILIHKKEIERIS